MAEGALFFHDEHHRGAANESEPAIVGTNAPAICQSASQLPQKNRHAEILKDQYTGSKTSHFSAPNIMVRRLPPANALS